MTSPKISKKQPVRVPDALQASEARYAALLERYHELALKGVSGNTPVLTLPPKGKKPKHSIITEAIREEAQGDPRLARFLTRRARELKAERKLTTEQIAAQLKTWETTEEDVA